MYTCFYLVFFLSQSLASAAVFQDKNHTNVRHEASINFIQENKMLLIAAIAIQITWYYAAYKDMEQKKQQEQAQNITFANNNRSTFQPKQEIKNNALCNQSYNNSYGIFSFQKPGHQLNQIKSILDNNDQKTKQTIDTFCDNIYPENTFDKEKAKNFLNSALTKEAIYTKLHSNSLIDYSGKIINLDLDTFFKAYQIYAEQSIKLLEITNDFFSSENTTQAKEKKYNLFKYYNSNKEILIQSWVPAVRQLGKTKIAIQKSFQDICFEYYDQYYATLQKIMYSPLYKQPNFYIFALQMLTTQSPNDQAVKSIRVLLQKVINQAIM